MLNANTIFSTSLSKAGRNLTDRLLKKTRWKLVVVVGIAVLRIVITLTYLLTSKVSLHDQGLARQNSVPNGCAA